MCIKQNLCKTRQAYDPDTEYLILNKQKKKKKIVICCIARVAAAPGLPVNHVEITTSHFTFRIPIRTE